jgi:hypothetical protein
MNVLNFVLLLQFLVTLSAVTYYAVFCMHRLYKTYLFKCILNSLHEMPLFQNRFGLD